MPGNLHTVGAEARFQAGRQATGNNDGSDCFLCRDIEKFLPSLVLEKQPPGHLSLHTMTADDPCLCPKTSDCVQGQNTLSTNYLDIILDS